MKPDVVVVVYRSNSSSNNDSPPHRHRLQTRCFRVGLGILFYCYGGVRRGLRRPRWQHNEVEPKPNNEFKPLAFPGLRQLLPLEIVDTGHTASHSFLQPPITKVYFEYRGFGASCLRRRPKMYYIYMYNQAKQVSRVLGVESSSNNDSPPHRHRLQTRCFLHFHTLSNL
jgi:hypothetical protein